MHLFLYRSYTKVWHLILHGSNKKVKRKQKNKILKLQSRLFLANINLFKVSITVEETRLFLLFYFADFVRKYQIHMYENFPSHQLFTYAETSFVVSIGKTLEINLY